MFCQIVVTMSSSRSDISLFPTILVTYVTGNVSYILNLCLGFWHTNSWMFTIIFISVSANGLFYTAIVAAFV